MKLIVDLKKRLVGGSIKKKNWKKVFRMVGDLPKLERKEWLEKNLTTCVLKISNGYIGDRGNMEKAFGLTQHLTEPQRSEYREEILAACFTGTPCWFPIDAIVKEITKSLSEPEKYNWLNKIFISCIENGYLLKAQEMAKQFSWTLPNEMLEKAIVACLEEAEKHGWGYYWCERIQETAKLFPEMLEEKLAIYVEKEDIYAAEEVVRCLSGPQKAQWIVKILQSSEEAGFRYLHPYHLAAELPEPQRTDWLKKILAVKVKRGDFHEAQFTARCLDRELATEELLEIMTKIRTQEWAGYYRKEIDKLLIQKGVALSM